MTVQSCLNIDFGGHSGFYGHEPCKFTHVQLSVIFKEHLYWSNSVINFRRNMFYVEVIGT